MIKLKNFIKIVNNDTPEYLRSLLPNTIGHVRPNSRHPDNYLLCKTRTETFRKSFICSSVKLWNETEPSKRTIEHIRSIMNPPRNELYNFGNRIENVKHAQLRMNCSKLNAHLYSLHVVDSPNCLCGNGIEDSEHYLLHCPIYTIPRVKLINLLDNVMYLNVNILLYGCEDYSHKENCDIFNAVHAYIFDTKRL